MCATHLLAVPYNHPQTARQHRPLAKQMVITEKRSTNHKHIKHANYSETLSLHLLSLIRLLTAPLYTHAELGHSVIIDCVYIFVFVYGRRFVCSNEREQRTSKHCSLKHQARGESIHQLRVCSPDGFVPALSSSLHSGWWKYLRQLVVDSGDYLWRLMNPNKYSATDSVNWE